MSVRIPRPVDRALDGAAWVCRTARAHPVATAVLALPPALAVAARWLPTAPTAYLAVAVVCLLAGALLNRAAERDTNARLRAERDEALREAGQQRHRANTLAAQLANDTVTTARIHTIGGTL